MQLTIDKNGVAKRTRHRRRRRDNRAKKLVITAAATVALFTVSAVCGFGGDKAAHSADSQPPAPVTLLHTSVDSQTFAVEQQTVDVEPQEPTHPWTDEELDAIVLTLAGECYDDKPLDKRLVCEVILNRVSNTGFGDTVVEVVTAANQFDGYWTQSRPISANDYEVAEQALEDWYAGGCEALSKYLFFEAGSNRENEFREEF